MVEITEPLISIIVPVYNVENYVRQCIESLQKQTYHNIEILLIDDGSTDMSGAICKEYVKKDIRVRYLRKENSGVADARNLGIEAAKGEYISFVDSDDWVTEDCIEVLYQMLRKYHSKISIGTYSRFKESDGTFQFHVFPEQYYEKVYSRKELLEHLPYLESYDLSFLTSWGMLLHHSLLQTIHFPSGKMHEDMGLNYKLFLQNRIIPYVNRPVYWYRERVDSLTGKGISEKKMFDDLMLRQERISILALKGYSIEEYKSQTYEYFKSWIEDAVQNGLENSDIGRRFIENLMLLEQ